MADVDDKASLGRRVARLATERTLSRFVYVAERGERST